MEITASVFLGCCAPYHCKVCLLVAPCCSIVAGVDKDTGGKRRMSVTPPLVSGRTDPLCVVGPIGLKHLVDAVLTTTQSFLTYEVGNLE